MNAGPVSSSPPLGVLSRPYRAVTLGMVALVALSAFEALAVATAMPTVARELDGLGLYALAFGGTLAASVVGMTLSGRLSDTRGPALAMWHGVAWFVAGLAIAGLAPTMWTLLLGRVVQGFGSGLINVAAYVVVGRVYPPELRPRVFASFSAAWVLPSIIGPTISGLIVEYIGWRWVFLGVPFLAIPAALALRPGLRALPATPATSAPPPLRRLGWAFGAALGAGALSLGGQLLSAHPEHAVGTRGPLGALLLGAGALAIGIFALRLLPPGTLRARRGLPAVIAVRGIAAAAFFGSETFVPLMLSREHGLSPAWSGLALTVGAIGWSTAAQYQSRGHWRWSRARLIQAGMAMLLVGISVIASAIAPSIPAVVAMLGWLLAGLGMGVVYPSLSVLTLELSPPGEQGANTSALQLCDSLSIATVLALGGSLFAALLPWSSPAAYLACFALTAVLAALGLAVAGRVATRRAG
ncbi:MAG: MFS transporter [Kofleriaceae bacterium]